MVYPSGRLPHPPSIGRSRARRNVLNDDDEDDQSQLQQAGGPSEAERAVAENFTTAGPSERTPARGRSNTARTLRFDQPESAPPQRRARAHSRPAKGQSDLDLEDDLAYEQAG